METTEELAAALRRSIGGIVRAVRSGTDALPAAHDATLGLLDRDGPMTIAEIARRRGVKHQGQARTVAELTESGSVERVASASDRRAVVVHIATAGRAALQRSRDARTDWLARALRDELDDEERALLERVPALLDRVTSHTD